MLISGYSISSASTPAAVEHQESINLNFTVVTFTEFGSDVTGNIGNPASIGYDAEKAKMV